jgi:hypothetical protein
MHSGTNKADAPSTIFETQLIIAFSGIQKRPTRVILGLTEEMDIGQEPSPGNTLTPFLR